MCFTAKLLFRNFVNVLHKDFKKQRFLELNLCVQMEWCLLLFMCSIAEGIFYILHLLLRKCFLKYK